MISVFMLISQSGLDCIAGSLLLHVCTWDSRQILLQDFAAP